MSYSHGVALPKLPDLVASRCSIFLWDVSRATAVVLPERYTPNNWLTNKFSAEFWLARELQASHWRTTDPAQADLVFLASNFSMQCRAGKQHTSRLMWKTLLPLLGYGSKPNGQLQAPLLNGTAVTPKLVVLTNQECKFPWSSTWLPKGISGIFDQQVRGVRGIIAPFVLARPSWLLGDAAAPATKAWARRKLLFFAGHVPKLYINPTRYLIWRQIRRHPGVTAVSASINCTVGQFSAACQTGGGVKTLSDDALHTFCRPFCRSRIADEERIALDELSEERKSRPILRGSKKIASAAALIHAPHISSPAAGCAKRSILQTACRGAYRQVNYTDELADIAFATQSLSAQQYQRAAMNHRFCLAAPGDFTSTPKITEFVAVAAAGGCLPVIVIFGPPQHTLPFTRWLDWCSIAVLVSERTARLRMEYVLRELEAMPISRTELMLAACVTVRDAFVWRPPGERPSAPQYLLAEACAMAQESKTSQGRQGRGRDRVASNRLDHRRCML
jgi:hypothetical protein